MPDYFALVRSVVARDVRERYGITVHDPYDCNETDCRSCRDFWFDEQIDRAHDEGKEQS